MWSFGGILYDKLPTQHASHPMRKTSPWIQLGILILLINAVFTIRFLLFLEAQSPAYLFINDTSDHVVGSTIGGTSPSVGIDLQPGHIQFIDMEFWWGKPSYFKGSPHSLIVTPTYDLYLLKIVKISTLKIDP